MSSFTMYGALNRNGCKLAKTKIHQTKGVVPMGHTKIIKVREITYRADSTI